MSANPRPLSAEQLERLVNDARLFAGELHRWRKCEQADAELDKDRRRQLRLGIVDEGFVWKPIDLSAPEIDLLYGMAREAARIALARRSAGFRATYGIDLTCGEAPE